MSKKTEKHLFRRTIRGGFWVFAFRIFTQILYFSRYIVLARVLASEDFGLLGVALLMKQMLGTFSTTGFRTALIQKKDNTQDYLDTAWTIEVFRGCLLASVMFFAAAYVDLPIFKIPADKVHITINIIRVTSLSFILSCLTNIGTVHFRKDMRFHREFILQISSTLTDVIITIGIAVIYRSVWALVLGNLSGNLMRCTLSYVLHPYRPRLRLDWSKAQEMWRFGKWIFGGTILSFLITQGDDYFVWGYLGVSALAFYQMAFKFSNIPATEITRVISQVTFPAMSKLQDEIPRLKDAYLKILQFSAFLSVPTAGLILILAPDFVMLFLKEKWEPIIPVMQILALRGLVVSIGTTRGPLFQAMGKPWLNTKLHILRLAILAILIYPMTALWGVKGTALTVLLVILLVQPFGMYLAIRSIRCRIYEMLRPIIFPLAATMVMLMVITLSRHGVLAEMTIVSFFLRAAIGIATYIATTYVFDRFFGYGIKRIIQEQMTALIK